MKSPVGVAARSMAASLLGILAGCQSMDVGGLDVLTSPIGRSYQKLREVATVSTNAHPDAGNGPTTVETRRLEQARLLVEAGRHADAEALLLDIKGQGYGRFFDFSKRTRKTFRKKLAKDQRLGDALNPQLVDPRAAFREEQLILLAESQFQQKKYAAAQDNYTELLSDFPSTQHIDKASGRLFEIGRYWLDTMNFEAAAQIRPAGVEAPTSGVDPNTTTGWLAGVPVLPNFTDGTRPVFDTRGRALQALKTIWLHDPTGPLADDAMMLTATSHLERGDNREADRVLTNLRKLYPDSPYLEPAFLLGSHVRLMGYQGSDYDQTPLDEAAQLKRSTLGLFPDIEEKTRLQKELADIDAARAEREWQRVEFYRKKSLPKAMAVHLNRILARFPGTAHEQRARQELLALGRQYANGQWMAREVRNAGNPLPVASRTEPQPASEPPLVLDGELPVRNSGDESSEPPRTLANPTEAQPATPAEATPASPTRQIPN